MSKQLSDLKKGTDTFYKKVNSHMESVKKHHDGKAGRESKAINDWFYKGTKK